MTWYTLIIQYTRYMTYYFVHAASSGISLGSSRAAGTSKVFSLWLWATVFSVEAWSDFEDSSSWFKMSQLRQPLVRRQARCHRQKIRIRFVTTYHNTSCKSAPQVCKVYMLYQWRHKCTTIDSPESRNLQSLCWYRFVCWLKITEVGWKWSARNSAAL